MPENCRRARDEREGLILVKQVPSLREQFTHEVLEERSRVGCHALRGHADLLGDCSDLLGVDVGGIQTVLLRPVQENPTGYLIIVDFIVFHCASA